MAVVVVLVLAGSAAAGDSSGKPAPASGEETGPEPAVVEATPIDIVPTASAGIEPRLSRKLERAYRTAHRHLSEFPSCQNLFRQLGRDGFETLDRTIYLQASSRRESTICGNAAMAFTTVDGRVTYLCRGFTRLSDDQAAVRVLHEALHGAGLDERPHDPDGMTPFEIDSLVMRSCGFGMLVVRR